MLLYYIGTILSYLSYQAAIGGLFFLLAKADSHNPLLTTTLLMVEPLLMLFSGLYIAKLIDKVRTNSSPYLYIALSTITLLSFVCLYVLQRQHTIFLYILLTYVVLMLAFMTERIYRQRLARDFANSTGTNRSRVNAIANLANRGAPVLSPFVLYLFPQGLSEAYLFSFIMTSVIASISFCGLAQKLAMSDKQTNITTSHPISLYSAEKLGIWHIWHLFLMNLTLGGLFMVLSQSILSTTNLVHFLQGPTLYFAGFWFAMLLLMLFPRKAMTTPQTGLYFTAAIGLCLVISSLGGVISIFALICAGLCYGFAINYLGTFIQHQLEHKRYSYYETRAQMYGRIALLLGLTITGWALSTAFSTNFLRGLIGIGVICSAGILSIIFLRYVNVSRHCALYNGIKIDH